MTLTDVLQRLYDSEINAGVESFWDGGWTAYLGDYMNGRKAEEHWMTLDEVATWLDKTARELHPHSDYAKQVS